MIINSNSNSNKFNGLHIDNKNYIPQENNNCYTYAINQPFNPYTKEKYTDYGYCQPGYLGGKKKEGRDKYNYNNHEILIDLAKKDLEDLGFEMTESVFEEYIENENCWKIAFAYDDTDYHWYRQNIDGTWSHKPGQGEVKNYDADDNVIYNPRECNRGRYKYFVGFYMIKKINNNNLMCA